MKALEEKILKEGVILSEDILKVDGFLNHQIDVKFLKEIGKEFYRIFQDEGITKILTIEASGIAIACFTADAFDVNVVFAKKSLSSNIGNDVYTSVVHSYTHGTDYTVTVSKSYLHENDRVLIVDDFMANGKAVEGLIDICEQAHCTVKGVGICIEKSYQHGGENIRQKGIRVESLARIRSMKNNQIIFDQTR